MGFFFSRTAPAKGGPATKFHSLELWVSIHFDDSSASTIFLRHASSKHFSPLFEVHQSDKAAPTVGNLKVNATKNTIKGHSVSEVL
jgi:hypothetical protein